MKLKIALLQLLPAGTTAEQLEKGKEACRRAKASGADVALFPEMWSCGYSIPEDVERLRELAVEADGSFVSAFGALAKELDMAVAVPGRRSGTGYGCRRHLPGAVRAPAAKQRGPV